MGSHVTLATIKCTSHSGDVDEQENQWVFSSDVALPNWSDIGALLSAFYNMGGVGVFGDELSSVIHPSYALYDISAHLNGSPHGAPFDMGNTSSPLGVDGSSLPGQIALVVDYHADLTGISEFGPSSRPRARRRGRHYHGPMPISALDEDSTTNIPFWKAAQVAAFVGAYHTLLAGVPAGIEWDVWSRKDAAVYPIIGGWVDTTPHRARHREEPTNVKVFWS